MNDLDYKISMLIDNELDNSEQTELFKMLANDNNARQTFAEYMNMKKEVGSYYSSKTADVTMPVKQPPIIKVKETKVYKTGFYFSAFAGLVMAVLLLFSYADNRVLNSKIEILNADLIGLTDMMKDFKTAMEMKPGLKENLKKITEETKPVKKNVLAKKVIDDPIIVKAREMIKEQRANSQFAMNKIVITKDDFIGGKVVAN